MFESEVRGTSEGAGLRALALVVETYVRHEIGIHGLLSLLSCPKRRIPSEMSKWSESERKRVGI